MTANHRVPSGTRDTYSLSELRVLKKSLTFPTQIQTQFLGMDKPGWLLVSVNPPFLDPLSLSHHLQCWFWWLGGARTDRSVLQTLRWKPGETNFYIFMFTLNFKLFHVPRLRLSRSSSSLLPHFLLSFSLISASSSSCSSPLSPLPLQFIPRHVDLPASLIYG